MTMRGKGASDAAMDELDPAMMSVVVEAMFAHEVAHCWRYMHGMWNALPPGFKDDASAHDGPEVSEEERASRRARREEGYADLVALAWTRSHHPDRYARFQAWLEAYRTNERVDGAEHDTLAWVQVARDERVFDQTGTAFEQALVPWRLGLLNGN
jgi:hypothetical protein